MQSVTDGSGSRVCACNPGDFHAPIANIDASLANNKGEECVQPAVSGEAYSAVPGGRFNFQEDTQDAGSQPT